MELTRAADYAVRVMIHLAGAPAGARPSHAEMAEAVECPKPFLAKVLQKLSGAGLIVSHRGSVGGFELPNSRRSVSILEIVEAVEGPLCLNLCVLDGKRCTRQTSCPAHCVWLEAQEALVRVLKSATVEDLARRGAGPLAPQKPAG